LSNFTEMDTEPMVIASARFTAEVRDLKSYVDNVRAAIKALGECWGDGEDGRAFGEMYQPWAADTISAMDAMLLRFDDTGVNTGMAALAAEATDEANATDLNGVGAQE
jgi:uncharacterized protein YukE